MTLSALPLTSVPRPALGGEPIEQDTAASFRCAACGEMAGVVKIARVGSTVEMGPPRGTKTYDRDAIIIDYFLGTTATLADTGISERYPGGPQQRRSRPRRPLHVDWELAPCYCPDCHLNYCRTGWHTYVLLDEGFYDCTLGTCPTGTAT